jgi:3',5'-cyclic AMP phosphodiesterase CpdA
MVANNQDRIIITVTHAMLEESGLFGSMMPENSIRDSSRFAEVLRRHRVDLWLCGHTHIPAFFNGKWKVGDGLKGTLFVNVSAIVKDPPAGSQSSLVIFKKGLSHCMVRARNHEYKKWEKKSDILFELSRPFEWDGAPPAADYEEKRR